MERIAVDEAVLEDLWRRLDATRWPDEPPDAGPEHGFGLADARELARYWRESYDWRAAEATLNGFESAVVEGVHHLADGSGPPLVLLHGWPSSVWEFTRVMPVLRAHARVIAPSLPGYTLLVPPRRPALLDRRLRGPDPRPDDRARPRALPGRGRRLGREHRRAGWRSPTPTPCRRCTCT